MRLFPLTTGELFTLDTATSHRLPHVSLFGRHQIQNVVVALAASEVTRGICLDAWAAA